MTFAPMLVSAQLAPPEKGTTQLPDLSNGGGLAGFLHWLILAILLFSGTIAVLFIIIGGYQYIMSGANEELAKKGKTTLTNAVIGLVIIILSFTVVSIVYNTLVRGI